MRRSGSSYTHKKRQKIRALTATVILLLGILLIFLDCKLRPLLRDYAGIGARQAAMQAVHRGVEDVLSQNTPEYENLVEIARNETGKVLSVVAKVGAVNRLKAAVSEAVAKQLEAIREQEVTVPFGDLFGSALLTGRGPYLPFTVNVTGAVFTDLNDRFEQSGINQTCHQLLLDMTVYLNVILPTDRASFELHTDFLICESVIVGDIPSDYSAFDLENLSSLENFLGQGD